MADDAASKVIPAATQRLGRSALFAFATTLTLAACSPAAQTDSGNNDAAADRPNTSDSPTTDDTGGPGPLYGAPMIDSGVTDTGGMLAMYGVPPPMDSGTSEDVRDSGMTGLRYGAPPPQDS
jgi:hypothetical protein